MKKKPLILLAMILLTLTIALQQPAYALKPTDLNNDGKVDIQDIATAAQAFGSYPGHPRWDPDADIDEDGRISIKDIIAIALDFGS